MTRIERFLQRLRLPKAIPMPNQTTQPPTDAATLDRSTGPTEYARPVHTVSRSPGVPDPSVTIDTAAYPELAPRTGAPPADEPSGHTPGIHVGEAVRCRCGCAWFSQVVPLSTGPRRIERVPGSAPIWRCANCARLYQEHPSNTLDEVAFDVGGNLYRPDLYRPDARETSGAAGSLP